MNENNPQEELTDAGEAESQEPDGEEQHYGPGPWAVIRSVVDSYYDIQRTRIMIGNRLKKYETGEMAADMHIAYLRDRHKELEEREKEITKMMVEVVTPDPTGIWLRKQRGIGPVLAAGLLSHFDPKPRWSACHLEKVKKRCPSNLAPSYDINAPPRCPHSVLLDPHHASSYWKFAGMYPGAKLVKGQPAPFSQKARVLSWKVGKSLLMLGNKRYVPLYYAAKEHYLATQGEALAESEPKSWKLHIDRMAMRIMVKSFLRDFWIQHRQNHGLPVDEPYAVGILGHTKVGE